MQRLQHEKHVVAEPRGGGAEVVHLFSERDLYTCQKRPSHLSKENKTRINRALNTCQKKPTKETCTHVKKNLQNRTVHMSKRDLYTCQKETSTRIQRNLYTCQKRPVKETYWQSRRYLSLQSHICRQRPIRMSKETRTHVKRDLQKRPTDNLDVIFSCRASWRRRWGKSQMSKETCSHVKRDLQKRPTDNLR